MKTVWLTVTAAVFTMALLFAALANGDYAAAQTSDTPTSVPTAVPTPEQTDDAALRDLLALEDKLNPPRYPNMDSNLNGIVQDAEASGFTAQAMTAAAGSAPIHREQSVAVTLYITEGYADAISAYLSDNGASPRNMGTDYIEAYVPVSLLPQVSEQEGVIIVRTIIPSQPAQGTVVSQGAAAHGAPAWHAADVRGQGVKIGVIDVGFEGFQSLMGTEVPATVQARCYTDIGVFNSNMSGCDNSDESEHGTAVTETAFDIAPNATYYISNPISYGDLQTAVQWLVAQDVDVINYSVSDFWDGPGDGTSPFSNSPLRAVDTAVTSGVTWVSSAGNQANTAWFGRFNKSAITSFHLWSGADINNCVLLNGGETFIAQLRWDDTWGGASRNLDMALWPRGVIDIVARSFDLQTGGAGHVPSEIIIYTPSISGIYCLTVSQRDDNANPSWIQLNVDGSSSTLQYHTSHHSISSPAESANPGLLAVGATHYWDTRTIADYSSQGPTPDGRIKPDIAGADCGEVVSYDLEPLNGSNCWFPGTSQASAHVAGLAALVKQRFPAFTPRQVTQYLKDHAEERGASGADNVWGHGFAKLLASDAPTPTPSVGDIEKEALVALYNATDGANWTDSTNWLNDGVPLNSWHGVTTDAEGRVTVLSLHGNNLAGSIPPELGNLANLRILGLSYNQLSGTIPVEIGSLANLWSIRFGYNQLTGTVPAKLGNLSNLEDLRLDNNQLSGTIQPEFGSLSKLKTLYLQGNRLTGALPQTFTQLTSLEVFAFSNGDAGLCAPADNAFQNWLQGISNQDLAAGVTPLGPDCTDSTTPTSTPTTVPPTPLSTVAATPTPTSTPTTVPTNTPAPTATPEPAVSTELENRVSVLEGIVETLKGLIAALESRVAALELSSTPEPIPTPTPVIPTSTPTRTPTPAPGITPEPTEEPSPTPTPVADACLTLITSDSDVLGSWDGTCPSTNRPLDATQPDDGDYYARYYSFTLRESSDVTISLNSTDADTFLYLLEGAGRDGTVAHFNDDIERSNTNSQISETLEAGDYTVEATTYGSDDTGDFTLSISGVQ